MGKSDFTGKATRLESNKYDLGQDSEMAKPNKSLGEACEQKFTYRTGACMESKTVVV